jgi:DNA primase
VAVVVEDCVSATVVGETMVGITGVALLGTNLMREHKEYLDRFDKVIVALDPDVIGKTIEYTKELKSYCDPSEVYALHIEDDLKYKRVNDFNKLRELIG